MSGNPYPGLRPFHADEAHLFFGRESQVDTMVDKLAATRFLAVVGTSGCGKSSLVNCGLRPALQRGLMAGAGSSWRIATCRPGADPIGELAQTLARPGVLFDAPAESAAGEAAAVAVPRAALIESTLRLSKRGLVDLVEQARLGAGTHLLLVVDQFEELYRYRALAGGDALTGQDAVALVNLLLEARAQTAAPIYVVLTMRSDFLGDCTQFLGLAEAINAGQYLVPRLTRDERRAAIAGPAAVAGGRISPTLLTRLVNDVGDNPDQLSILQHALNRTWAGWAAARQPDTPLALPHYEAIGGMAHALGRHAERALAELTGPPAHALAERVFKALTDRADDPRGMRRPTRLGALCAITEASPEAVQAVLAAFRKPSRSFLMPPADEPLAPDTVIDISHESLMRVWERLKRWSEDEAQSALHYRRVAQTAGLHAAGHAGLWRDPDLQLALDWRTRTRPNAAWAARYAPGFDAAMVFLDRSLAKREADLALSAEQARQAQEDQLARATAEAEASVQAAYAQRMKRRAWLSAALAAAAISFAVLAVWQTRDAHRSGVAALKQKEIAEAALEGERLLRRRAYGLPERTADSKQPKASTPLPGAAAGTPPASPAKVAFTTLYIQVQSIEQKGWGEALRKAANEHRLKMPGIELVRIGPQKPELRYFRREDEATARVTADWLTNTPGLADLATKSMVTAVEHATDSPMELWYGAPPSILVIAGSFTDRESALAQQKRLQDQALSMQVVDNQSYPKLTAGYFAVVMGPYRSNAEAQEPLRQVQALVKDAYVKSGR